MRVCAIASIRDDVDVDVPDGVAVGRTSPRVGFAVGVFVALGDGVSVGVALTVGVGLDVGEAVADGVGEAVAVSILVGVAGRVTLGVASRITGPVQQVKPSSRINISETCFIFTLHGGS